MIGFHKVSLIIRQIVGVATSKMVLRTAPRQMQMLPEEVEDDEILLALVPEQKVTKKTVLCHSVRPWITRRPMFGDYEKWS